MGKNLVQQKRGKGSPSYRAPSFRYAGKVTQIRKDKVIVDDIINSTGHSAPLIKLKSENEVYFSIAPEGIRVGDVLEKGLDVNIKTGNTLPLGKIPEGVSIFNIESNPGDNGKLVRTSGTTAKIVSRTRTKVIVKMPSGKQKEFNPKCMASIGVVAGSGRTDKPFLKAGNKKKAMAARGKYWPIVSGASMNAVDHPLGGARSSRKGRPTIAPKNAPPGRKVGMIRPRQTGRNK
ncbi:50S ribosomal protein L2 [archaeon]|nr:50S ribosomal protein L2 [archaeon]MBL7056704.1 50S ribosomal protein L2 [Candidatus Woesearchaeota archaeon]